MQESDSLFRLDFTGGFAPPYLAYYDSPACSDVAKAHALIEETVEVDGPFDGIVGFSQGAGLAMAYLLHHRINFPDTPSPFKFAMFFSTSSLQSPDQSYKRTEIMDVLEDLDDEGIHSFHETFMTQTATQKDFIDAPFMKTIDSSKREFLSQLGWSACLAWRTRGGLGITDKVDMLERLNSNTATRELFPRFYHPAYTKERLDLPTVHSWGRGDTDALKQSATMGYELCQKGSAVSVPHGGRHEVPTDRHIVTAIANEIEKAFYLGQQQYLSSSM